MAKLIGDLLSETLTALLKDPNTATPAGLSATDIESIRLELNKMQGATISEKAIEEKELRKTAGRGMLRL